MGVAEDFRSAKGSHRSAKKKSDITTGFIAQEVEALVNKTGVTFSGIHIPENDQDSYGIRYADFVVPLVKAVQELSEITKAQQAEIKNLKTIIQKDRLSDTNPLNGYQ